MNVAQQRSNEGIAQVIDYIEVCFLFAARTSGRSFFEGKNITLMQTLLTITSQARQEAVRVELQDIEADEEQQQQQQQQQSVPSSSHQHHGSSSQMHHQSSSSSFRSHPHRQQEQSSSTTSYRQPALQQQQQQQHQYSPVASSSGTSGLANITNQLQSQQQSQLQQQQRKQRRSLSPLVSRSSAASAPTSSTQALHNRVPTAPLPYQQQQHHRHFSGENDAERTQESIPLASSSSIPNSPATRFSPDLVPSQAQAGGDGSIQGQASAVQSRSIGVTTPLEDEEDASLVNTSSTAAAVSPLTRLQAKRERERERHHHHHHHDRRGRHHNHGSHTNESNHGSNGVNGGMQTPAISSSAAATVAAGVKRRWTAALLPEHHTINLSMNLNSNATSDYDTHASNTTTTDELSSEDDEEDGVIESEQQSMGKAVVAEHNTAVSGMEENDSAMMEMDDASYRIDGNSRPSKRTARR